MKSKFVLSRQLTNYKLSEDVDPNDNIVKELNNIIAAYALSLIGSTSNFNKDKFIESINEIKKGIVNKENKLAILVEQSNYKIEIINNECWLINKLNINI